MAPLIATRLHGATGWSAPVMKLGIASVNSRHRMAGSCLMLVDDLIQEPWPPAFDIDVAFALFRRSAINLLIWRHSSTTLLIFKPVRSHTILVYS